MFYFVDYLVKQPLPDVNYKYYHIDFFGFIQSLVNENINGAFWFFYLIIALYILTPIISVLANKHRNVLFYIVCIDFVLNFLIMYVNKTVLNWNITTYALTSTANSYIGFYIMGFLIKVDYFSEKQIKFFKYIGLASLLLVMLIGFFKFQIKSPFISGLGDYNGPLNFTYTIGFYIICKEYVAKMDFFNKTGVKNVLAILSSLSLGIYVLHPFFLEGFMKLTNTQFDSWLDILVMPMVTYLSCGFVVYILKKIPYVKRVLP
ncbi:acyltransferase family protein [Fructilactobacillus myrtifloralis]|uniref:Acyltransferase family protein n=1 Tax=Fructilactobacillus myrtifloralis TaxID=2940301 RepID=A0ABY5BTU6_9LACO|nr:acyltransferase family protein [Fructilactobacillus myrtifloralis]